MRHAVAVPASLVRIRLLGELELRVEAGPLPPLESARAESLLAYLALHRDAPQPRRRLAFLLWPDSTEPQARTNLRHVLHNLRRAVPELDRFLEVTPRALRWRPEGSCWLDVAAFGDALARADTDGVAALREAVELYRGDLLEGSQDDWLLPEREDLRRRFVQAMERLVAQLGARGDHAEAILHAERLLRHDPLHEPAYRTLMALHDARGDRARALHVYHECAAVLERELGVEPSAPTRQVYEDLLPSGGPVAAGREAGPAGPLTGPPLVGRAGEWARLTALWRAAERGAAQLVLVTGEPGVGKTRLADELRSWCAHRGAVTASAASYAAEGALAYGPVVTWLRVEALAGPLTRLDPGLRGELARLLPELRASAPVVPGPEPLSAGDQRQRLFDALAQALLSSGRPLLLVADDLHWADRETLRFLHYLLRVRPSAAMLVAATVRPEELDHRHPLQDLTAGLRGLGRLTEIELGRLSMEETGALAERLAGRQLQEPDTRRLFAETEGNPLFVVEALRAGWGGGDGGMSPRVQAVIEARLGQLGASARGLVDLAATVGREFTTDVRAGAGELDEDELLGDLDELWRRRIVQERGADAYDFTHDRIREVAYRAMSPAMRRRTHLRVARTLERLHGQDPGPVAAQVAAHYEHVGALDQAVGWYERAAEMAQRLQASAEAVRLLERALDLLASLPPSRERQARELAVLAALPAPVGAVEGWASDRLAQIQRRGLQLAGELGVEPGPPLLHSLAIASLTRGDFQTAQQVAAGLCAGGERDGDDVRVVEGEYVLGIAAFWTGAFGAARRHFERAVERYRPEQRPMHVARYGLDPKVVCTSRLANTLWFLGRPDGAARARSAALGLADEVGHPHSRHTALVFAAMLALESGDLERLRDHASMLGALRHELWRPTQVSTEALEGFVEVLDGRREAGMARLWKALDDPAEAEHAPGLHASVARLLLGACVAAGDARTGLVAVDRALGLGDRVRTWESECRRLRGEFLAAAGAPADQIEEELRHALAVARRQGATMLELRAATSVLRHRAGGDPEQVRQARAALAAVVDRLPEPTQTPELREATRQLARS
jgi:DNA-binding SARP family transcriptional activator